MGKQKRVFTLSLDVLHHGLSGYRSSPRPTTRWVGYVDAMSTHAVLAKVLYQVTNITVDVKTCQAKHRALNMKPVEPLFTEPCGRNRKFRNF
jgi:hypothetical protein